MSLEQPTHPDLAVACFAACWEVRPDMGTLEFARVVNAVIVDEEVRLAMITLWARRDHLTAPEVDALRTALGLPRKTAEQLVEEAHQRWAAEVGALDDGGFAEEFLERQRQARRHLRLVD